MGIARDALEIIGILTAIMIVVVIIGWITGAWNWWFPLLSGLVLGAGVLFFFRDPFRLIPDVENAVVAPADGKIVEILTVYEPEFFQQEVVRISIFLSIFDVHINRIPISGKVSYYNYNPGAFLPAYREKASLLNEQTSIGITNGVHKVLVRQIAGLLARRIVCTIREGEDVLQGSRFGLIKFGSRVDLFLPPVVHLQIEKGQKVKGGETVIGVLPHE